MNHLSFLSIPKIISYPGAIESLPEHIISFKAQRILIVTDPGLVKLGYISTVQELLTKVDLQVFIFDEVQADPSYEVVIKATKYAQQNKIDLVLAIGGGSSMDAAKIISICIHSNQSLDDMVGVDKFKVIKPP